ncbi:RDM1 protein [Nymphaea thermarum]|nr:RDM1 protein [Nymphaea thermarum]
MKRSGPWNEVEELSSDSDSVSDEGFQMASSKRRNKDGNAASTKDIASESKNYKMTDKGKGTQVASDSLVIRSSRVDINASRPTSQHGAAYASEEQPLWVGIKVVTKYVGGGGGNVRFVCGFCQTAFVGSYTRVRAHLLKLPHFGIRACSKISTEKVREFKKLQEHADSIQKKKSSAIATDASMPLKGFDKKRKTCQNTIETYFNSCGRAELDRMAGKFFFSTGIPFSVAENPYWKKFVTALANSKLSGYVPPSPERLRTSLLKDEKDAIEQNLARKKFKWNTTGVSIVSDGWIDIQRHPSINFIAVASDEPIFLRTFDTSERHKDVEYLKSLFVKVIKEVGPDKVVQIITDNAAVCKSVESGVLNRRAQIYQEHMKGIPLPTDHQAVIPCVTWQGLAKSIKRIYGQPLHYLTNVLMKQWDLARMETDDYHWPLEYIIHPCKAAATIWAIEEVHRLTCSHEHLANLWAADPMHSAFLDPVSNAQTT